MTETIRLTVFSFVLPGQRFIFKRSAFSQRYVKLDFNLYATLGAFETFVGSKVLKEGINALSKAGKLRSLDSDCEVLLIS